MAATYPGAETDPIFAATGATAAALALKQDAATAATDSELAAAIAAVELLARKNQANGYPGLDGNTKILASQIPSVSLFDVNVVDSEAEMLAIPGAVEGFLAVRTDIEATFIHNGGTSGTAADWTELPVAAAVTSVAGKIGNVVLGISDIQLLADTLDAINLDLTALNRHFGQGGLLIGVPDDYDPPFPFDADVIVGDIFGHAAEPGSKDGGAGASALVGHAGPMWLDRISQRLSAQTMVSANAIGDNPQIRARQAPGWGHGFLTPGMDVIRRRPVGQATHVGAPAAPGASEVFVFPAKSFPSSFQEDDTAGLTGTTFGIGDNPNAEYTSKSSRNAWLSGTAAAGATECTIALIQTEGFPAEGYVRIRSQQLHYDAVSTVLDAGADGIHKAGASTIVAKNVTQAEWDAIPHGAGCIRLTRTVGGSKAFKYTSATYNSGTEKATFNLDPVTKLDKNLIDGAAVQMSKLTGITSDFVHFCYAAEAGATKIKLGVTIFGEDGPTDIGLANPYDPDDPVEQELIDLIPTSGRLRVELWDQDPAGPGQYDFPTTALDYTDFDPETREITLAAPLPLPVHVNSLVEIPGCPGLFRERTNGQEFTMHLLGGVTGLTNGADVGDVVQYEPRYGQPTAPSAHFAFDRWIGRSGIRGYEGAMFGSETTPGSGSQWRWTVRLPVSEERWQKFIIAPEGSSALGAGVRGHSDIRHNFHVGDYYTQVHPPNIEFDCDCEEDDEECECDDSETLGGEILSGNLSVPTVIGFPTAGRLRLQIHNRETGTERERVFDYTGTTEGPPEAKFTGVTFDQTSQGPKNTLASDHVLSGLTTITTNEATTGALGFPVPFAGFAGKWRAVATLGGSVLATGTHTGTTGNTLTGVTVLTGTGTLPAGTIIEENYSIGDFWVTAGNEISIADDQRHAAIGSGTNVKSGTDRPDEVQVEIGVGDNGLPGVMIGDEELVRDADDDLTWAGDKLASFGAVEEAGDLIIGSGPGTIERLGVDSDDYVLTLADGLPAWRPPSEAIATGAAVFKSLVRSAGAATTAADPTKKYFLVPGQQNQNSPSAIGQSISHPFVYCLDPTRFEILGADVKLALEAFLAVGGTNPSITVTVGLYAVTIVSGNYTLGSLVSGSAVALTPGGNNRFVPDTPALSADFVPPAAGYYAHGYVVSGTPSAGFSVHADLLEHSV